MTRLSSSFSLSCPFPSVTRLSQNFQYTVILISTVILHDVFPPQPLLASLFCIHISVQFLSCYPYMPSHTSLSSSVDCKLLEMGTSLTHPVLLALSKVRQVLSGNIRCYYFPLPTPLRIWVTVNSLLPCLPGSVLNWLHLQSLFLKALHATSLLKPQDDGMFFGLFLFCMFICLVLKAPTNLAPS